MQLRDYFEPINAPRQKLQYMPEEDSLRNQVVYGIGERESEKDYISEFDIAIIGIADSKNALGNDGCNEAAKEIRSCLSTLRKTTKPIKIIDLGDVRGNTLNDRYFAMLEVIRILVENNVVSLVIGGGQDYVLPVAKGLNSVIKDLAITIIDSKLDLSIGCSDFNSQTFLSQIDEDCGESIFDLNILGAQKYLIGASQEEKFQENNWQCTRLKDLRNENISYAEPILRDSDLVGFDVGAIQKSCMPYFSNSNVNGFTGYEACQLSWYAGMSSKVKTFCLQEYSPLCDNAGNGVMLCAEIIWHFLDGMSQKINSIVKDELADCKISVVYLQDFEVNIRFYTNKENNRCWVEVPWDNSSKIVACNFKDLLQAQNGELPDKWWRFFQLSNKIRPK